MTNEKHAPIIGAVLLVLGIVIIIFVFYQAFSLVNGVGDYFNEQFPEEEGEEKGPTAQFSWSTNDLSVDFWDESEEGDAQITSWEWNFGDGESSNEPSPQHTYNSGDDYRVRLRVEDQNGKSSTVYGNVYVEFGNQEGGSAEPEFDDFSFGFGNFMIPFAAALLVGLLFIVMFLVGGALIKAGWNLLKPGPSTIKMKIKPKRLEVESAEQAPMYSSQPIPTSAPITAQPTTPYYPQPTPATAQTTPEQTPMNPVNPPPGAGAQAEQPIQSPQPEQKPTQEQPPST